MDNSDENPLLSVLNICKNPFSHECHEMSLLRRKLNVQFRHICNGVLEYGIDKNNHTDESNCLTNEWPCDSFHFKCNGIWNCPDGHDELGCERLTRSSIYCNNTQHFCLDQLTGNPICLPLININNNIIECLGSFDERNYCQMKHPFEHKRRYRCQNSTLCIDIISLCDCIQDCPENDDETLACHWRYGIETNCNYSSIIPNSCSIRDLDNYDGKSDLFCDLANTVNIYLWNSHQRKMNHSIINKRQVKQQIIEKKLNYSILWICNRGIYVRSTKDSDGFICLCSNSYYGNRCQYQQKRISLSLQMKMLTLFHKKLSLYTFLVLLVHINQSNITILSHVQFLYVPTLECHTSITTELYYPQDKKYYSLTNNFIHIHLFNRETLKHEKSWSFSLKFEFLPVQILFKRLELPETDTNIQSNKIPIPYNPCRSFSNNSICIDHDIHICSLNYDGHRCLLPFNPCMNMTCNKHGQCIPTGIYYAEYNQFLCICDEGWFGDDCSVLRPIIYVSIDQDLLFSLSNIAFLHTNHITALNTALPQQIYLKHFYKNMSNLTFILYRELFDIEMIFIQLYKHKDEFDYYFVLYAPFEWIKSSSIFQIDSSHRCRTIHELFDEQILLQPPINRVKYYQQPCRQYQNDINPLICFYDEELMCVCRQDNYTDCFKFHANLHQCDHNWCHNQGNCIQDDSMCPTYSVCICEQCAYGSYCEFSTYGYSLSLDGIIGSHLSFNISKFSQYSQIAQIAIILIFLTIFLGIILNLLPIGTFIQKETHEVGCGFYLLFSSIFGLLTQIILILKIILLLFDEQNDLSCSILEFFLKWCPITCEWLNSCVAIERTIAVKLKAKYSRSKSKSICKWIICLVIIIVGLFCLLDFVFRRIIYNQIDQRYWCVLKLNQEQPGLLAIYSILNISSFLIPLLINVSSGIIIVFGTLESNQRTNKNSEDNNNNKQKIR